MSSIKKSIKKVFKKVKKVVKKFAKPALIIAGTLFTAGVASGAGFGAFASLGSATGVGKIGAFMGAVGQTISHGVSTLTGGMFGTSMTPSMTISQLSQREGMGALSSTLSALPGAGGEITQGSNGGIMGNVMGALRSFASTDTGRLVIAQGIMNGLQSYSAARQADEERDRFDSEYVFGTQRRGGDGSSVIEGPSHSFTQNRPSFPSQAPFSPTRNQPQQPPQGPGLMGPFMSPGPQNPQPPQNQQAAAPVMAGQPQGGQFWQGSGLLNPMGPNYG